MFYAHSEHLRMPAKTRPSNHPKTVMNTSAETLPGPQAAPYPADRSGRAARRAWRRGN